MQVKGTLSFSRYNPVYIIFFLVLLTAGGDILSIKVAGLTVRLVAVFAFVGLLLLLTSGKKIFVDKTSTYMLLGLTFSSLVSLYASYDYFRTAAYTLWLLYIAIILIPFIHATVKYLDNKTVINYWIMSNRIQASLLLLQTLIMFVGNTLSINDRPSLWFYEPSYAAIYFSAYFAFSLYLSACGRSRYRIDLLLGLFALLVLTSATAIISIAISLIAVSMLAKKIKYLFLIGAVIYLLLYLGSISYFSESYAYQLMFGFLFNESDGSINFVDSLLLRAGNRPERFFNGINAFVANPLIGIGFGSDNVFNTVHGSNLTSIENNPFINPFIEIFATMGVLGGGLFVIFIFTSISTIGKYFNRPESLVESKAIIIGLLVMFATMQFEGTLLRFYLWVLFGLVLGISSGLLKKPQPIRPG